MIKKITTILAMLMLTIFIAACGPATKPATTMTADPSTSAEPSASTESVDELIAMVNDFVTSGEITGQAENGLLAKLDSIRQKVMDGQMDAASNEMGAFVNEVQAQLGKKITETAANALIARAQAVAAEFLAGIPVTGGETATAATTDTVQPTTDAATTVQPTGNPTMEIVLTPMGDQLEHQAQWDAIALQVAEQVGFSTFDYDIFQLPANTTWEDTLAYYEVQAAAAGWGDAPTETNEMDFGHYAVWSMTGADGTTHYFVVAQVDTPAGIYTLNITGTN